MQARMVLMGTAEIMLCEYAVAKDIKIFISKPVAGQQSFHLYVAAPDSPVERIESVVSLLWPSSEKAAIKSEGSGKMLEAAQKVAGSLHACWLIRARKKQTVDLLFKEMADQLVNLEKAYADQEARRSDPRGPLRQRIESLKLPNSGYNV